ncbi:MAG TPA: hypothetical protein VIM14_16530, partial [Polyangia bacterium]
MKRGTVLSVGFSMIVTLGLFTFGCSSDSGSGTPTKLDAGKKDGGGADGKGGSGGSNASGGSNGSGGSSASGGSNGSGGSSAKGG